MATGVSVKMGVTGVSAFKRDINDAKATVAAMTAALKLNESQMKLTGNAESGMRTKADLLKQAIKAQTEIVEKAHAELAKLKNQGVDPASKKFKDMETNVYKAATKLNEMKKELQGVEEGSTDAAEGLKKTDETVDKISKNQSWANVADGIGKITNTLEKGARAAVNFGKKLMSSLKDSTGWADDLLTLSTQTDIDVETLQKMEHLADLVDTDVDAIIKAKQRMRKAAAGEGADDIMELFGIDVSGYDPDDLFWELGDAILNMGDAFDKEAAAQKVFGRNWTELLPLFKMGREEYDKMLAEQSYLTEDQVKSLGQADDSIKQFEQQIADLKNKFWSENADKITELLQWLVDNKDKVSSALKVIAAGFGALKIAEFAVNMAKTLSGFKELLRLGGGGTAAPTATGGGGGFFSTAKTAATGWIGQQLSLFGAAGGFSVLAPLAGLTGLGIIGKKLIDANLNDANLNKIYGDENDMDLLDRLTQEQLRLVKEYEDLYKNAYGSNEAMDARDALQRSLEASGIYNDEQGVGLLENIFENQLREMDPDGMVEKYDRITSKYEESAANQIQSNSEMTAAAGELKGLPAAVAAAVVNGMNGVTIVIGESAVGAIGRRIGGSLASGVRALTK